MPITTSSTFGAVAKWVFVRMVLRWWRQLTSRPVFYPNRDTLEKESPLGEKMRKSERMYALWLTGTKAIVEIPSVNKVERLLLPDPKSKSLAYFQSAMEDKRDLGREIRESSRLARDKNITVRWLKEFLGYSITIGNPRSDNAWVQIEIAFPALHGGNHPSFEFRKPKHAETIDSVIKMFDTMCGDEYSREPEDSELENGTR